MTNLELTDDFLTYNIAIRTLLKNILTILHIYFDYYYFSMYFECIFIAIKPCFVSTITYDYI